MTLEEFEEQWPLIDERFEDLLFAGFKDRLDGHDVEPINMVEFNREIQKEWPVTVTTPYQESISQPWRYAIIGKGDDGQVYTVQRVIE